VGDLRDYGALHEINASARSITSADIRVDMTIRLAALRDLLQL
jgi:hypothetical protein